MLLYRGYIKNFEDSWNEFAVKFVRLKPHEQNEALATIQREYEENSDKWLSDEEISQEED